jgi:hypothetical protein
VLTLPSLVAYPADTMKWPNPRSAFADHVESTLAQGLQNFPLGKAHGRYLIWATTAWPNSEHFSSFTGSPSSRI